MKKISILALFIILLFTGCGKVKTTTVQLDGFSFEMPNMFLGNAITLNDIAQAENYDSNATLSYKDSDSYIFYNKNSVVVLAQKGTAFDYSKNQSVENYDFLGAHFAKLGSSHNYKDGKKIPVSASVSLTNLIYGDYEGTLIILDNNPEVSVFVGTRTGMELTYSQKQTIKQIVSSVKYHDAPAAQELPTYQGAETPSKKEEEKEEPKEDPVVDKDSYTIKSYDVEGNVIEENLKITNVYREMPSFLNVDRSPSTGMHFECVEYSLDHSPLEEFYYVNVYVRSENGDRLSHRGVSYPKRTYDYYDLMTENYDKIYCYYEIPNGLTKYSLEFVNQIEHNSSKFTLTCK